MRRYKKILGVFVLLLIIIQFIQPKKNIATTTSVNGVGKVFPVPTEVQTIFKKSCNDCHSNQTVYPWYSRIQPLAWWIAHHVNEGKREINLDEFATYSPAKQYHKLEETVEKVRNGEMPMPSYTWGHRNAILTATEKEILINWATDFRHALEVKYPMDSLVRKRKPAREK